MSITADLGVPECVHFTNSDTQCEYVSTHGLTYLIHDLYNCKVSIKCLWKKKLLHTQLKSYNIDIAVQCYNNSLPLCCQDFSEIKLQIIWNNISVTTEQNHSHRCFK